MSSASTPPSPDSSRPLDAQAVLRTLEEMQAALPPGAPFPAYRELMRDLGASERAVRSALDELVRQGKILRRQGRGGSVVGPRDSSRATQASESAGAEMRTIVAISQPDRSIFDRALHLLFQHAQDNGLSLLYRLIPEDLNTFPVPPARTQYSGEHPLGYLLFQRGLEPLGLRLQAAGHRVVLLGAPLQNQILGVPNVYSDHEQGGYLATRHLLQLGHRRLAYCGEADLTHTRRFPGHERALHEWTRKGVPVSSTLLFTEEMESWKRDPEAGRAYFARANAPTAIAVWNDQLAMVLLSVLNFLGLRVPEDVSLVGYDNLPEGADVVPALTTLDGAIETQLQAALGILTRAEPPPPNHAIVVLPSLVARQSTRQVKAY